MKRGWFVLAIVAAIGCATTAESRLVGNWHWSYEAVDPNETEWEWGMVEFASSGRFFMGGDCAGIDDCFMSNGYWWVVDGALCLGDSRLDQVLRPSTEDCRWRFDSQGGEIRILKPGFLPDAYIPLRRGFPRGFPLSFNKAS